MTRFEIHDLATTLLGNGWTVDDREDTLDSLRTNWETPMDEEDVIAVYDEMVAVSKERE